MKTFYCTMSSDQIKHHFNQRTVGGCVKVIAEDSDTAQDMMYAEYGPKWAFLYESLAEVHYLDRDILDTLEER